MMACGRWVDDLACGEDRCTFTSAEWARVKGLALPAGEAPPPPPDPSNAYLPIVDWPTRARAPGASPADDGTLIEDATQDPVVQLGWRLYHEPALSGSLTNIDTMGRAAPSSRPVLCGQINVSCATCHDPKHYGTDLTSVPRHVSIGAGWYDVNAQQTLNVARQPILYWNGRTDTLWAQAAQVIESRVSMNGHRMKTFWVVVQNYWSDYAAIFIDSAPAAQALAAKLVAPPPDADTDTYRHQYDQDIVSPDLDPGQSNQATVTRVHVNAAKAIAAYEWLLSSSGSAFDRFVAEGPGSTVLSPAAQRGLRLFVGRASCIDCHNTPLLSDGKFHDIGIPQAGEHVPTLGECETASCNCANGATGAKCLPLGAFAGRQSLLGAAFRRGSIYDDNAAASPTSQGTNSTADTIQAQAPPEDAWIGAWRTPSLRDVSNTAPYMHDGLLPTLADVVWHYDQGGGEGGAIGRSELSPLGLAAQDREDLVAFLESLTGVPGPADLVDPPVAGLAPAVTCTLAAAASDPTSGMAGEASTNGSLP